MKSAKTLAMLVAVGTLAVSASAQLVSFNFPNIGKAIPDADPTLGPGVNFDKQSVSGVPDSAGYVLGSVSFDLEGNPFGNNGDMYVKLLHTTADGSQSAYSILANRVGRGAVNDQGYGYPDNGMNVTLVRDGSAGAPSTDLHFYQNGTYSTAANNGAISGTFLADGRDINPASIGSAFPTAGRTSTLSAFDGISMNGTWTLLVMDESNGAVEKLSSWGLTFTNVPEPYEYALIAGLGLLGFAAYRRFAVKTA